MLLRKNVRIEKQNGDLYLTRIVSHLGKEIWFMYLHFNDVSPLFESRLQKNFTATQMKHFHSKHPPLIYIVDGDTTCLSFSGTLWKFLDFAKARRSCVMRREKVLKRISGYGNTVRKFLVKRTWGGWINRRSFPLRLPHLLGVFFSFCKIANLDGGLIFF